MLFSSQVKKIDQQGRENIYLIASSCHFPVLIASLIGFRNFRICLCLEVGSKTQEAIPYCKKAISVCKSRIQRLMNEAQKPSASNSPVSNQSVEVSSVESAADKVEEIETLNALLGDLERKASVSRHMPIASLHSIH